MGSVGYLQSRVLRGQCSAGCIDLYEAGWAVQRWGLEEEGNILGSFCVTLNRSGSGKDKQLSLFEQIKQK